VELTELKEEALKEYWKQSKSAKKGWQNFIGVQSEWLQGIGWGLVFFAIIPPFFALGKLIGNQGYSYLAADGTRITASAPIDSYGMGNQSISLQQVANYIDTTHIAHNLWYAGIASVILVIIAMILWFVDAGITKSKQNKFVEQYIFEHGKASK